MADVTGIPTNKKIVVKNKGKDVRQFIADNVPTGEKMDEAKLMQWLKDKNIVVVEITVKAKYADKELSSLYTSLPIKFGDSDGVLDENAEQIRKRLTDFDKKLETLVEKWSNEVG